MQGIGEEVSGWTSTDVKLQRGLLNDPVVPRSAYSKSRVLGDETLGCLFIISFLMDSFAWSRDDIVVLRQQIRYFPAMLLRF